jgi:hypothetical protein
MLWSGMNSAPSFEFAYVTGGAFVALAAISLFACMLWKYQGHLTSSKVAAGLVVGSLACAAILAVSYYILYSPRR